MIPRETIDKIVDASRVEDVIGEFITLKKRGVNLIGLCPFHGEKTPSFTVSPTKGIYKCFGCGKSGNTVNFVMDHMQLSYPEALRWLAKKYGIEIVEKEITPEEKEKQTERESMLIVMQFAQRYFTDAMNNSDEGKSIGLGYFIERELQPHIIEKFALGYSPENRYAFSQAAVKAGYQPKYLVATGMSIARNDHPEGTELTAKDIFDRYAGRVMFPIHDDGGRVVAFGGRTLSSDKKIAKYINSPETPIYHKSRVLYGLWQGKKAIQQNDTCYLVEGYMDVIAMHQAGIENVVASSGTSLTVEQIKAIHRFTRNVVVLYDGDEAGQKASNRAIPLLLEEGMNVRLLMFPDNDDPDSFSRKVGSEEFRTYLKENTQDFLLFKAKKLNEETKNDPIKRATVIKDIVDSIALIPDNIIRSVYIKDCASVMEMEETILQTEVNKIRRKAAQKSNTENRFESPSPAVEEAVPVEEAEETIQEKSTFIYDAEEKELLRIMLNYGSLLVSIDVEDEQQEKQKMQISLAEYILFDLFRDQLEFINPIHKTVLDECISDLSNNRIPDAKRFLNSDNPVVSSFVINHIVNNHDLSSKWSSFGVFVTEEITGIQKATTNILYSLKEKKVNQEILRLQDSLKEVQTEQLDELLLQIKHLSEIKQHLNKILGRIVVK